MGANFTPTFGAYSPLTPFRYWCQKVLPLVYDDSLSYYECLNKTVDYLNKTMEDVDTLHGDTEAMLAAFNQLQTYVNTYFDELDLTEEVQTVLDRMAENGSLDALLRPIVGEQIGSVVAEQIDDVVASQIYNTVAEQINSTVVAVLNGSTVVQNSVEGWLNEHIPTGDIVIDDTLSISGAAADASAVGNVIGQQFSILENYIAGDYVLYNGVLYRFTATHMAGAWTGTDATAVKIGGEVSNLQTQLNAVAQVLYKTDISSNSGLIPFHAKTGDIITIKTIDESLFQHADQLRFYDAGGNYIKYWSTIPVTTNTRTFTYDQSTEAFYIGLTKVSDGVVDYYVINNENDYNKEQEIVDVQNDIVNLRSTVNKIDTDLYEQTTILTDSNYQVFPISNGEDIIITTADGSTLPEGNPYLQCYDSNKTFTQQFLCSSAYGTFRRVTITAGNVGYIKMYTTPSKAIKVYIPDSSKIIPMTREISNIVGQDPIIVDSSGNGDYASLTLALKENVDSGKKILVMPGTYNIVAEYKAIWGDTVVDNMADSDSAIFDGFQYGAIIRNREIEFCPGSKVVCDWTGHTVDGTHRFSAIRVDYNCKITGLNLISTATFYAIHDDYGLAVPYTVEYENCRVEGVNLYNADCIGGGCKKYSKHILKNCYFNNNLTNSATVRYHNTNAEGAEPEIYVSNCYFNNWFTPRWYGTQTSKMKVYVNNCEARAIYKMAESSNFDVDNVELYKWCNTETNPVTP